MFSEPFMMEALYKVIIKQREENTIIKDHKKNSDYAMNSQRNLAKFKSRFAQARSYYKRQKTLRTLSPCSVRVILCSLCLLR